MHPKGVALALVSLGCKVTSNVTKEVLFSLIACTVTKSACLHADYTDARISKYVAYSNSYFNVRCFTKKHLSSLIIGSNCSISHHHAVAYISAWCRVARDKVCCTHGFWGGRTAGGVPQEQVHTPIITKAKDEYPPRFKYLTELGRYDLPMQT